MKRAAWRVALSIPLLPLFLVAVFLFQPHWISRSVSRVNPGALFSVPVQEPYVALTIDDSPDPESTRKILEVLDTNDARATFFLITENIHANEQIVQQILNEGHEIGNHMTTDEATIALPDPEFEEKIQIADETLNQFAEVNWFRPGAGLYDRDMVETADSYGYQIALGSVHPLDPHIPSTRFFVWYVEHNVKPGSIIILHDGGSRGDRTVTALSEILPDLVEQGYQIITLSELAEMAEGGE